MEELRAEIDKMPGIWRAVWKSLLAKYIINVNTYGDLSLASPSQINIGHKVTRFWEMNSGRAMDKHGWDWWGDTDIFVDEIVGPKTFEEACEVAIIKGKLSMCAKKCTGKEEKYDDWKELWSKACRDLENDLPHWPGAPLKAAWINDPEYDGNYAVMIVQKDATTYYVVTLATS